MIFDFIYIAALIATAAAVPHRPRHLHQHPNRRDLQVDVVTDIVTATDAAAVIYVNQNGQPVSTSFAAQAAPTATTSTTPAEGPPGGYPPQPAPTFTSAEASYAPPAPESTASISSPDSPTPLASSSASSSSSGSGSGSGSESGSGSGSTSSWGYGLSYSPYNSDSSCKTQDQVNTDVDGFANDGYGMIRIYGTDCNQVQTVMNAAGDKGMKIFAGVFDINQAANETQTLINAANGDWSAIHSVAIGNEAVTSGSASVNDVLSALSSSRSTLRTAGFNGPVVTVETYDFLQQPEGTPLCQASDYAAANCHAFFDADLIADQAGAYVAEQQKAVQSKCGKDAMITESGWPSAGDVNGMAVPSEENQRTAISSLKSSFANNIVLFSAYNDLWKQNSAATFNAEKYWGIHGNSPSD